MVKDGVFRTDDMVEATVISMHGLTPSFERSGRHAVFCFILDGEFDDESLEELVSAIRCGRHRVEPKRFAREMRAVRESMYEFLGITREQRRIKRK